jgi:hypothetical protein
MTGEAKSGMQAQKGAYAMPRTKLLWTRRDAKRLADAARDAGLTVTGMERDPNGTIRVLTGNTAPEAEAQEAPNPWDKVLTDAAHEKRTA